MNRLQTTDNSLGYEVIGKLLRIFAIPGIILLLINSLYNILDQIFIGQGVGFLGNWAANIIVPIAVAALLGCVLVAYFSHLLGKGEPEKEEEAVRSTLIASAGISFIFAVADKLAFVFSLILNVYAFQTIDKIFLLGN